MQNVLFDVIIIIDKCDESVTFGDGNKFFWLYGQSARRSDDGKTANR